MGLVGLDEVVVNFFYSRLVKYMCNYWDNPMDKAHDINTVNCRI